MVEKNAKIEGPDFRSLHTGPIIQKPKLAIVMSGCIFYKF